MAVAEHRFSLTDSMNTLHYRGVEGFAEGWTTSLMDE